MYCYYHTRHEKDSGQLYLYFLADNMHTNNNHK